jgi:hypothetical protein
MVIEEGDTVLTLWAATPPAHAIPPGYEGGDFMCLLVKKKAGGLAGEYRFRYHAGPGFDADDKISRWSMSAKDDSPERRKKVEDSMRKMMALMGFDNVHEAAVNGGMPQFQAALLAMPGWSINMRREGK